jgi:hypothetical protein
MIDNPQARGIANSAAGRQMQLIEEEGEHHLNSPVACGRIAMTVYGALSSAPGLMGSADYFALCMYDEDGDLDMVPDGTDPFYIVPSGVWPEEMLG